MDYLKAIDERISRRTYLDTPVEPNKIKTLNDSINKYNQEAELAMELIPDGSKAFNGLRKSYGMFKNVRTIIVLKGKKEDADLKEKLGQYGELLVLEATGMGLGTCWVAGTFDRNNGVLNVGDKEELVCVITVGNIAAEQTFKEKLVRGMTHRKTKAAEELYKSDVPAPQWLLTGIHAVQKAPSAVNLQPVKFEFRNGILTANVEEDRYLTDLGIAKVHFTLAAGGNFELGNHGEYHN